uniref:Uncharacterized protein n=1 Tax=Plectus sambesii TaxID=2011161 RepID=A0A914WF56_9BILA
MSSPTLLKALCLAIFVGCVSGQRSVYAPVPSSAFNVSPSPREAPEEAPVAIRGRKPQQGLVPLRPSPQDNRFSRPVASGAAAPPASSFEAVTQAPGLQQYTLFPTLPTLFPLDPTLAALFGLPPSPGAGAVGSPLLLPAAPAPAFAAPTQVDQGSAPVYASPPSSNVAGAPQQQQQQNVVYTDQQVPTATLLPPLVFPPALAALFGVQTAAGAPLPPPDAAPAAFAAPIATASEPIAVPSNAAPAYEQNVAYVDQGAPTALPTASPLLFTLHPSLAALFGVQTAAGNGAPLAPPNAPSVEAAPAAPAGFAALPQLSNPLSLPVFSPPVAAPVVQSSRQKTK